METADDGEGDAGLCRRPGTIRVEVSETVTIITDLMDTAAYPARDIAELYGMRWASKLVYLEEKQTLSGGQPITAATPAGACRMAAATVAAHQALRVTGASIAAATGAEPARISATALRNVVTASIGAGQGATAGTLAAAIEIIRRDITAHPLRFVTAWRPGRHYPRFTIKKVRARKSNDVVPAATQLHLLPLPATPGSQQPNPRRPPDLAPGRPARHPPRRNPGMPGTPRPRPARPVPGTPRTPSPDTTRRSHGT